MDSIELRLADWHRLYKELQEARQRLELTRCPDAALQEDVRRLQEESDAALSSIHEEFQSRPGGQQPLSW